MAKEDNNRGLRKFSGMSIFILIAATLWLMIKLSDTYSINVPFAINYINVPADQILEDDNYTVEATLKCTGFKLLNYYFVRKSHRSVDISLQSIKFRKENQYYSYNSSYIEEEIALFMNISNNDVNVKDDALYFKMNRLASKKVKVSPDINIIFERQYNFYGDIVIQPDSIIIFGAENDIATTDEVHTERIEFRNVKKSIETSSKLALKEYLSSDTKEVIVKINVEKYTEAEITIPISVPDNIKLHLFPDKVHAKYIVAMKDYEKINSLSFKAEIDTNELYFNDMLPVNLVLSPNNTQVIDLEPSEVEYVIIQN
ncbi:MAG: hypothetical protein ACI358_00880 [Candidatus Limimorpha sp.]